MTEERRMITIDYQSWYDQNFIIPEWGEMEIAPPKDWRPFCYSPACKLGLSQGVMSMEKEPCANCPYRKME